MNSDKNKKSSQTIGQGWLDKWKNLNLTKKSATVFLLLIAVFVTIAILSLITANLSQDTGLQTRSLNPTSDRGLSSNMTSSGSAESVAMDSAFAPPNIYEESYVPGTNAEDFEINNYHAFIKTSQLEKTCRLIEDLKPNPEVIFESAKQGKNNCYYRFKTVNSNTASVLSVINELNPEQLDQDTRTIKKQLQNQLSQRGILESNLSAVEKVLEEALVSYDRLLEIATAEQNTTALTEAIRDKINLIDQLKQRREQTKQQIDILNRSIADQEDRLLYTYFTVNVQEWKYIDGESIKNSWKFALKQTVDVVNEALQKATLGLITFITYLGLLIIYVFVGVVIIKLTWRGIRRIWKG